MNRIAKRSLQVVAGLAGLVAVASATAAVVSELKARRTVPVEVRPVAYTADPAAVKHGGYLYASRGCADCHGADGAGKVVIDDPIGLFVRGANVTTGAGSAVRDYREADWVRTIRHGVHPSGRPLQVMPSEDYNRLTDQDLAALVAYVRSLPPVDSAPAEVRMPLLVKALYAVGVVTDAAAKIDHGRPPPDPVPAGPTVEHGAYVAQGCTGCHGEHLSGGKIPGAPPAWPAAANLTPGEGSAMARYPSPEAFVAMMRSGKRPDGSAVNPVMPFEAFRAMTEDDLVAIARYLETVPARPTGQR